MKKWRYTGKVYEISDFDWVYFPIGCEKGYGDLKGEDKSIDFAILPDGTLAELEEAELEWVDAESQ